jgi:hypothetical protein
MIADQLGTLRARVQSDTEQSPSSHAETQRREWDMSDLRFSQTETPSRYSPEINQTASASTQ